MKQVLTSVWIFASARLRRSHQRAVTKQVIHQREMRKLAVKNARSRNGLEA